MPRSWIRLYTDLPNSAKVQRLPDHLFRFLINCWCLTGASKDDCLPELEEIAWTLKIDAGICRAYVDHLLEQNVLIRRQGSGKIVPKNWDDRQFLSDSARDRTRKYRERIKKPVMKRHSDAVVTVQYSDTDSDSDPQAPERAFAALYEKHPRKTKRYLAETAVAAIFAPLVGTDRTRTASEIVTVHAAWCDSEEWTKESGRFAPALDRWLTEQRWKDGLPPKAADEWAS